MSARRKMRPPPKPALARAALRSAPPPPAPPTHGDWRPHDLVAGWKAQTPSIRILRAFLGVTFLYAGMQKLADPNFLHAGGFDYIGTQLRSFSEGSPIAGVLRLFEHVPVLTGIGIAMLEIAVGLGTLLGIAPVAAAAIGLGVNVILFLSATWHVHPYFLGSDSIYAVAWIVYLVAVVEARRRATPRRPGLVPGRRTYDEQRRKFLRAGVLWAGTLLFGGVAKAMAGSPAATATRNRASAPSKPKTNASQGPAPQQVKGTPVASLDSIPVGGAIGFNAPGGGPCVLLRPSTNDVEAYSRICTHAGCLVGYDQQSRILFCPCHGAEFDPAHGGRAIRGPAYNPLRRIPVAIDAQTNQVVVTQ